MEERARERCSSLDLSKYTKKRKPNPTEEAGNDEGIKLICSWKIRDSVGHARDFHGENWFYKTKTWPEYFSSRINYEGGAFQRDIFDA